MMADARAGHITALLQRHHAGDREAFDTLVTLVYDHLRRIARRQLARARPSETLNTTALVHEAYVQLEKETGVVWQSRSHFFGICARAMRRIIVDHARHRGAQKRGNGVPPEPLDRADLSVDGQAELAVAVDEALVSLAGVNDRLVRVVECRYFAGMTEEETATALGTSLRTVQRDWMRARAWLLRELGNPPLEQPR